MIVIKRDGKRVTFDPNKIAIAVSKANNEMSDDKKISLSDLDMVLAGINTRISQYEKDHSSIEVQTLQDIVQKSLMASRYYDVARKYITYRHDRTKIRNRKSKLMKQIGAKILALDVQNQNANVDERSFGGRRGQAAGQLMKQYALDNCMSQMARNNHINNEVYIHDLDSYALGMHNCLSIPFDDLLKNGFNTRQTDVRPANSINTAFQLIAVIFQLQSLQQFGGCSATHLDWTMVPYVRKSFHKHFCDGMKYLKNCPVNLLHADQISIEDIYYKSYGSAYRYAIDMTDRELKQAVEGLFHNLNTGAVKW